MPNLLSRGLFNLFFGARRKAFASLPGLLGNLGDFLGPPPWDVCARYGRTYGGSTLIWMGPSPALVLNDPALIEEVLETRRLEFEAQLARDIPSTLYRQPGIPFVWSGTEAQVELSPGEVKSLAR